jgi:hypothetical protein
MISNATNDWDFRRAHRDVHGDGIVMEIDVVATAVGAAQDSHLRAVEHGRSVNEPAANLPQLDVRVRQNMWHSVRFALIHEVAHELDKYPTDNVNHLLPVEASCVHQPLHRATHGCFVSPRSQVNAGIGYTSRYLCCMYAYPGATPLVVSKKENRNDN